MTRWLATTAAAAGLLAGCGGAAADPHATGAPAARLAVEVLDRFPHDPDAFTQGLELHDGLLYESTGRYGRSDVRAVDPGTGVVRTREALPEHLFGEGLTVVDDRLWQLTWREGTALHRDRRTLAEVGRAGYDGEGWGLCYDAGADRLVMSDGTPVLTFRDPESFAPTGTVRVTRAGAPVEMINELECVDGEVWANIWLTDEIVRIDPATGRVDAVVDASGLLPAADRAGADVLNGIAAVPGTDHFLLTGKLWPSVFLVRFVPAG